MHKFWIKYSGEMRQCRFYETWSEVPYQVFIEATRKAKVLEERQTAYNDLVQQLNDRKKEYETAYFNKDKKAAKILAQSKRIQSQLQKAHESLHLAKIDAISLYTDAPVDYLVNTETDIPRESDGKVDMANWNISPRHIMFFENLFYLLTQQKLGDEKADRLLWQTATDEEIAEMTKRYSELSILQRLTKRGRKLKQCIKKARSSEFIVAPIWEQSTYANSKFQEMANRITEEMESGNFDSTQYLVAMLFIEKGASYQAANGQDATTALENRQRWFKQQFDRNHELFFKQKKVMSIEDVLRIRNFFLAKRPKWQKVTRMSWLPKMNLRK